MARRPWQWSTPRGRAVVDAVAALADGAPPVHPAPRANRCYDWECGDAAATARAFAAASHVTRLTLARQSPRHLLPGAARGPRGVGRRRRALHASRVASERARAGAQPRAHPPRSPRAGPLRDGGRRRRIRLEDPALSRVRGARVGGAPPRPPGQVGVEPQPRASSPTPSRATTCSRASWPSTRTGRVTALRVHSIQNLGAYVATGMPISIILNMERMVSGLYAIPAIHLRLEGAFTNTVPINVYRGVGRLECVYTVERLIERAARETGRDPIALRRLNMVRAFPYRDGHRRRLRLGRLRRAPRRGARARRRRRGFPRGARTPRGAASCAASASGRTSRAPAGCRASMPRCGCCPRGPWRFPSAASPRGRATRPSSPRSSPSGSACPSRRCASSMGDTDLVADGVGTFASRSMVRGGSAAVEAVDLVVDAGKRMAAHLLEAALADVEYRRRRVHRRRHRPVDRHLRRRAGRRARGRCPPLSAPRSPPRGCTRTARSRSRTAARCASWRSIPRPAPSPSPRGRWWTTRAAR